MSDGMLQICDCVLHICDGMLQSCDGMLQICDGMLPAADAPPSLAHVALVVATRRRNTPPQLAVAHRHRTSHAVSRRCRKTMSQRRRKFATCRLTAVAYLQHAFANPKMRRSKAGSHLQLAVAEPSQIATRRRKKAVAHRRRVEATAVMQIQALPYRHPPSPPPPHDVCTNQPGR